MTPAIDRKGMSGPALRTFFRIAELWHLSDTEQAIILGVKSTHIAILKNDDHVVLSDDTLERISYVLGMYKALQILLPDIQAADSWVNRANIAPLFGGRSALDRMLSGNVADLFVVRQYLDAERGGHDHSQPVSADPAF